MFEKPGVVIPAQRTERDEHSPARRRQSQEAEIFTNGTRSARMSICRRGGRWSLASVCPRLHCRQFLLILSIKTHDPCAVAATFAFCTLDERYPAKAICYRRNHGKERTNKHKQLLLLLATASAVKPICLSPPGTSTGVQGLPGTAIESRRECVVCG